MHHRISRLTAVVLSLANAGCVGTTFIMTSPRDAEVFVDGKKAESRALRYSRWVGSEYRIRATAPGFEPQEKVADVHLGNRAAGVALACVASIIGIPFVPAALFNGELDDRIYISLKPSEP